MSVCECESARSSNLSRLGGCVNHAHSLTVRRVLLASRTFHPFDPHLHWRCKPDPIGSLQRMLGRSVIATDTCQFGCTVGSAWPFKL